MIVSSQVALSLVLLAVSASLVQGFRGELLQGPGFRTDHIFLTSFDTQLVHYSPQQTQKFYDDLLRTARSAPGVRSAALVSNAPMAGIDNVDVVVDSAPLPRGEKARAGLGTYVSDGYFRTMDTPIIVGRGFLESDRENTPLVAVVNEHMAGHFWNGNGALGKRFHLGTATGPLVEIVGIARKAKYAWIAEPPMDFVYLSFRQHPRSQMSLLTESDAADAATLAPVLRDVVRRLDPDMPVYDVRTMHEFFTLRAERTSGIITQVVAGMGLDGSAAGAGGPLWARGIFGEPAHTRDRYSHGHRGGPANGGEDGAGAGTATLRRRRCRGPGVQRFRLPAGDVGALVCHLRTR